MTFTVKSVIRLLLLALLFVPFSTEDTSLGFIGGADGPTAIFVSPAGDTYKRIAAIGCIAGDFAITLHNDGTFIYVENPASSYIGMGTYTNNDGIITLTEDAPGCRGAVNRFKLDGNSISFIAEGSDNFIYITLSDGAVFTK